MIPNGLRSSGAWVLRKFSNRAGFAPQMRGASGPLNSNISFPSLARFAGMLMVIFVIGALLVTGHAHLHPLAGLAIVIGRTATEPKKPANIRQMEADFKALAKELEIGQTEMANGPIPQARGEELEEKAKQMEELQKHLDQYNNIAGIVKKAREVESPTLPTDAKGNRKRVVTSPGALFVLSEALRQYQQQGKQGWSAWVDVKSRLGKKARLYGDEAVAFEAKAFSEGQLSDLGDDAVIEVDRDREIVRFEEPEILTIRDVLNVSPTTSDTIRYVKLTEVNRAAKSQESRGAPKPYMTVKAEAVNTSVETIAVLSKVTEQDIEDAPRLISVINGEMALDVRVEEERQLLWGSGADGEVKGLFTEGIPEFDRATVDDTVIDTIRKMRTDLRKSKRVLPSFVLIDPLDWETVELLKGSDDRYIWGLITDLRGPRIWSLRVVESDAMTNDATGERRLVVGDGVRGATIYDRHDVRLAIGYVDDDFARNLRTLRAEERIALAVKRPWAFEFATTAAGES